MIEIWLGVGRQLITCFSQSSGGLESENLDLSAVRYPARRGRHPDLQRERDSKFINLAKSSIKQSMKPPASTPAVGCWI